MWWLTKTTPSGRFEPHLLNLQQLSHTLLLNVAAEFVHSRLYQSHLSLVSKNLQCRQQDHLRVRRGSALCAFHLFYYFIYLSYSIYLSSYSIILFYSIYPILFIYPRILLFYLFILLFYLFILLFYLFIYYFIYLFILLFYLFYLFFIFLARVDWIHTYWACIIMQSKMASKRQANPSCATGISFIEFLLDKSESRLHYSH